MKNENNTQDNDLIDTIDEYKRSIFKLADLLYSYKIKYSWLKAKELSGLDHHKFQWFLTIGSFINRTHNLLPEFYIEVAGLSTDKANKYLSLAIKDKLTPCQLRKVIRATESNKSIKKPSNNIKISNASKYCLLLKNQMDKMSPEDKIRTKAFLNTL